MTEQFSTKFTSSSCPKEASWFPLIRWNWSSRCRFFDLGIEHWTTGSLKSCDYSNFVRSTQFYFLMTIWIFMNFPEDFQTVALFILKSPYRLHFVLPVAHSQSDAGPLGLWSSRLLGQFRWGKPLRRWGCRPRFYQIWFSKIQCVPILILFDLVWIFIHLLNVLNSFDANIKHPAPLSSNTSRQASLALA